MRSIADLAVVAPADAPSLRRGAAGHVGHPRHRSTSASPRARDPTSTAAASISSSAARSCHGAGADLTLIATGSMVHPRSRRPRILRAEGVAVGVIDMHTIKPLDSSAVLAAAAAPAG